MNSDEISAALGRLGESIPKTLEELADAFAGGVWSTATLRHSLIELLEQADPDTHIELPVDADGIPIGVGDTMRLSDGRTVVVDAVCDDGFVFHDSIAWLMHAETARHLHTASVEDVLRDFAMELGSIVDDDTLVGYADRLRGLRRDEVRLD